MFWQLVRLHHPFATNISYITDEAGIIILSILYYMFDFLFQNGPARKLSTGMSCFSAVCWPNWWQPIIYSRSKEPQPYFNIKTRPGCYAIHPPLRDI